MPAEAKEAKNKGEKREEERKKTSDEFFAWYYVRILVACNLIEFQIRVFSYIFLWYSKSCISETSKFTH